ncbi:1975_t:CDS:2, partial [Scutellospora calospora]
KESISVSSSEIASSKQQKASSRPFNPVWEHFNQIEKKKSGHYSASCKYCPEKWQRANTATLKFHIAHNCPNAPLEAQLFYFKELTKDDENQNANKKRTIDSKNKGNILKFVENQELPSKRQDHLEDGMCCAFVCAGISFNITENEIFRAWLQDLRPATLVAQFFRSCHIANSALEKEIQINNIEGGGIKRYVATRWSSYYDTLYSILRLKVAFIRVKEISYIDRELTLEDVLIVANEIEELDADNYEEDYVEDSEVEFESLDEILSLEEKFDLNHEIFGGNSESNNVSLRSSSENIVEEPNYNYDVNNLVDEIFT